MQYGPRLGPWTVAAVSAVFGLAAAQVALAANVAALTEPKAPAASSDGFVLPKGGEETLAQAIDPVPLLPRNLTDQASMHAIADYDKSSFDQAAGFISMFNDGSPGLQARPGEEDAVTKLLQDLVINQQSPFDDGDNPDARRQNRISELAPLTFDADNADRLAIIGVSMFDLGVAMQAPGSVTLAIPPPSFKQRALALLQAGSSVFPANRALAIDYPSCRAPYPPPARLRWHTSSTASSRSRTGCRPIRPIFTIG